MTPQEVRSPIQPVQQRRVRFERRSGVPRYWSLVTPLLSLLLTLLLAAVILSLIGADSWGTLRAMYKGAFGDYYGWEGTILKAIPLMLTGLAVAVGMHMRWWNIGAEGQLVSGAVCATGIAIFTDLPGYLTIPLMMTAGFVGGALWAELAGLLQVWLGMNEIISTLMLNYVAIVATDYLLYGPWANPSPAHRGFPQTVQFANSARLPTIPGSRIHLGLMIAVIIAALLSFALNRTRWGFEVDVIGRSRSAARYAGMHIRRNILLIAFLSGGLAGLAGMTEVSGVIHKLDRGLAIGTGYTAIVIACLAQLNPWAVLVVSILFAAFQVGGDYIQFAQGIPASINLVLQGSLLVIFIAGEALTRYRVRYG